MFISYADRSCRASATSNCATSSPWTPSPPRARSAGRPSVSATRSRRSASRSPSLERLVGGSLFDRPGGPRPVELTPLGKVVLAHAREVIGRVDAAGEAIERFLAGDSGRIDVGTFQSVSNVLLPAIVAELRDEHPTLDIRLFEDEHKEQGCRRVQDGELDVTFCVGSAPATWSRSCCSTTRSCSWPGAATCRPGRSRPRQLDRTSLIGYPVGPCQQEIEDGLRNVRRRPDLSSSAPTTTAPRSRWCGPAWGGP